MNRCLFISQNWNANVRTLVGGLTLLCFLFMFPGLVEALQTALVRTSDGGVYQIRFAIKTQGVVVIIWAILSRIFRFTINQEG